MQAVLLAKDQFDILDNDGQFLVPRVALNQAVHERLRQSTIDEFRQSVSNGLDSQGIFKENILPTE